MFRNSLVAAPLLLLSMNVQSADWTGTMKQVNDAKRFVIGYTPDAAPLSFENDSGEAVGYSVELCRRIAAAVKRELGLDQMQIDYAPLVSPQDRMDAVINGDVDIECGASTVTLSRRAKVDFTLMTLVTGASVLAKKESGIASTADLSGKSIAVIKGTTTEAALNKFLQTNLFDAEVLTADTHEAGVALLNEGKVDAYASDQIMLVGQIIQAEDKSAYALARDVFSFEPYAFMVRKDDSQFRLVADRALAQLYRSAAIQRLYHTWFGRFGIEPSPVLKAMYQFQGLPD
ncbi:MAG: amino acid ABC transporter substrate-binding protein [Planctomycetota bacterium]|jgi:ABC-type amino acid transport substrate-binding protein